MRLFSIRCGCAALLLASFCAAQSNNSPAGEWLVTTDLFGTSLQQILTLKADGDKLSGSMRGRGHSEIEGTVSGNTIHFATRQEKDTTGEYEGTISGDGMSGTARAFDSKPEERLAVKWTARRLPPVPAGPPQRHDFVPTKFHRAFSPFVEPALHIKSGDSVHTTTVDAGGRDEKGASRVLGGNPETGPFYIDGALPGDILKVKLNSLRLNRDWAGSDDALVSRAVSPDLAREMKYEPDGVRWKLDRQRGLATLEKPGEHMKNFAIPVKPMLGCVATAPGTTGQPVAAGDSGGFGGNMDFNEVGEGATVYLPVNVVGALLYVGDGHALQGDGELNGNALETSMDVDFTVEVLKDKKVNTPFVETDQYFEAMALAGSLDDAFRQATGNLTSWLIDEYKLTPSEAAVMMGSSVEYRISEVADRNAGVVARLRKDRLAMLTR
jgi:amidase